MNEKKLKAIRHNVKTGGQWDEPLWRKARIQIVQGLPDQAARRECLGAIFGKPSTALLSNGEARAVILGIQYGWFTDDFIAFLREGWKTSPTSENRP
jgi:hypothetical protein